MGFVTLEAVYPYYDKTNYEKDSEEFNDHLKKAIIIDLCYQQGLIDYADREYYNIRVKTKKFSITINDKTYSLRIGKWDAGKEKLEDYIDRYKKNLSLKINMFLNLAQEIFNNNTLNKLDYSVQLISKANALPLTIEQIKKLLPRINSSYARSIYLSWSNNPNDKALNSEIRRLAQITVDKYGLAIVKYIISLPFTQAANSNLKLYSTSDKNEVPLHTIQVNIEGEEQLIINFHLVSNPNRQKRAYVFKKNKEKEVKLIGYINQDGELKTNQVYQPYFNPQLLVVLNQQNKVVYGGLHPGHCIECGRELTVPESIILGIGPECYQKYGHLTLPDNGVLPNHN